MDFFELFYERGGKCLSVIRARNIEFLSLKLKMSFLRFFCSSAFVILSASNAVKDEE